MFSFDTANFGWEESNNGSTPAGETAKPEPPAQVGRGRSNNVLTAMAGVGGWVERGKGRGMGDVCKSVNNNKYYWDNFKNKRKISKPTKYFT